MYIIEGNGFSKGNSNVIMINRNISSISLSQLLLIYFVSTEKLFN